MRRTWVGFRKTGPALLEPVESSLAQKTWQVQATNISPYIHTHLYSFQAVWLQTLLSNGTCPGTDTPVIPSWMIRDSVLPQIAAELKPADPELSLREYGLAQASFTYRGYQVVEHGGDVPGQKSQVIRLPGEMIGIAIMVNDEQLGGTFHEVAKWRIIDELLGLKPIDWESR
jgi:hypothetical protein